MDCAALEVCRLGSGPVNPDDGARRPFAGIMQRAFYDGHHRMHDIKILTIYGPNGMTLAVYGPTSGREWDPTLLNWSNWDNYIRDLCMQVHGHIFCSYADQIFAGFWYTVRTAHRPLPTLGLLITPAQQNEKDNMNSARESIEHSYNRPKRVFPLIDASEFKKLGLDPDLIYAEIRVTLFLTNVLTCLRRGNTCTGHRFFACAPPTLQDYLNGTPRVY